MDASRFGVDTPPVPHCGDSSKGSLFIIDWYSEYTPVDENLETIKKTGT
jgi:hypothetical protein